MAQVVKNAASIAEVRRRSEMPIDGSLRRSRTRDRPVSAYNGPEQTVDILGVRVCRLDIAEILEVASAAIEEGGKLFLATPNVYSVTEAAKDPKFKDALDIADIAAPDGVPLVWASHILGKGCSGRVSGADFFELLTARAAERGYRCFFLGGGPGGSERVVEHLQLRFPALKIAGNFSPPFGELSDELTGRIVNAINSVSPDILWVGLGSPRQEKWIAENLDQLRVRFAVGVGAAFYYAGGVKKRAPRWMRNVGLEWSYRILREDLSLFWRKRYYAVFHEFLIPVLAQALKTRLRSFLRRPKVAE
jgi:N-acetylglucosaminyldiphosphoundecaprenol N-acetyl-beta-D-mannosaminyltransferase